MSLDAALAELVAMANGMDSIYASYGGIDPRLFNKLVAVGTTTTAEAVVDFLDHANDNTFAWAARLLVFMNPELALQRGLHLDRRSRIAFTDLEWRLPAPILARWFAQLLESDDPDCTRLALAPSPAKPLRGERLEPPLSMKDAAHRLIITSPDFIPVDLVRARLDDADADIRRGAIHLLCWLHHPEDAERVIAAASPTGPWSIQWLAALPSAARLLPWLDDAEYLELLRRRRCAGLSNTELPRRTIDPVSAHADAIALERRDHELAEQRLHRGGLLGSSNTAHALLAMLGKRGLALLDSWKDYPWEPYGKFIRAYRQAVKQHPQPPHEAFFPVETLRNADEQFTAGTLDGPSSAFSLYAHVLYWIPDHAYAAYQLAWIDRAYGTPITPERIAWLRELGAPHADELAIPTTPLPNTTYYGHMRREPVKTGAAERDAHLDRARRAIRR